MVLILAALLLSACAGVREAPVEDRQSTDTAVPVPAPVAPAPQPADQEPPVADFPAGQPLADEDQEQWVQLPPPDGDDDDADATPMPTAGQRPSENPAVLALLDDTDVHISEGNPDAAADSIERALRLEPKNPWLWHRLAALKLEQGLWQQAVTLAQKSNSLAAGYPALHKANVDLIAQAKKQQ